MQNPQPNHLTCDPDHHHDPHVLTYNHFQDMGLIIVLYNSHIFLCGCLTVCFVP